MKNLIRCQNTKAFLARGGAWTKDPGEARGFSSPSAAIRVIYALRLWDVEIYHHFDECHSRHWDFAVSVRPRPQPETVSLTFPA